MKKIEKTTEHLYFNMLYIKLLKNNSPVKYNKVSPVQRQNFKCRSCLFDGV